MEEHIHNQNEEFIGAKQDKWMEKRRKVANEYKNVPSFLQESILILSDVISRAEVKKLSSAQKERVVAASKKIEALASELDFMFNGDAVDAADSEPAEPTQPPQPLPPLLTLFPVWIVYKSPNIDMLVKSLLQACRADLAIDFQQNISEYLATIYVLSLSENRITFDEIRKMVPEAQSTDIIIAVNNGKIIIGESHAQKKECSDVMETESVPIIKLKGKFNYDHSYWNISPEPLSAAMELEKFKSWIESRIQTV